MPVFFVFVFSVTDLSLSGPLLNARIELHNILIGTMEINAKSLANYLQIPSQIRLTERNISGPYDKSKTELIVENTAVFKKFQS